VLLSGINAHEVLASCEAVVPSVLLGDMRRRVIAEASLELTSTCY
jgi:hypothetical protein